MENGQLNLFEPGKDGEILYRFFNQKSTNGKNFTKDEVMAVTIAGQVKRDEHI